jgi:hypothetical protein
MSTSSNLYAEKVFSEHPTGLWALDDDAHYVSLISEQQRDLSNWTILGGVASSYPQSIGEPFIDSYVGRIVATPSTNQVASVTATSADIIEIPKLNKYLKTFSVGGYFYSESAYVVGFEIGYQYGEIRFH